MDKPTQHPRWASDGADITEPPESGANASKDVGVGNPQSLYREYLNWVINLVYMWIAWFDQVTHRTDDFSADQALPGGTAPAIGAGRNILANAFSARVFVDGYEMGPITGPTANYTYSANSDTYWDLGRDGVWTPAVVAAMASEPAVTADSKRVYRVRTDASDRTALADYRRDRVAWTEQIDSTGNVRLTTETVSRTGASGASPNTEMYAAPVTHYVDDIAGFNYQALGDVTSAGLTGWSLYAQIAGVSGPLGPGLNMGLTAVWGAHLNSSNTWTADQTEVFRFDFAPSSSTQGIKFFRKTGLTLPTTFADSTWDDEAAANTTRMQLPIAAGLKLGGAPFGQLTGANANLTPILEWVRNSTTRTLLSADLTVGDLPTLEYIGDSFHERVVNATWSADTTQWSRGGSGDAWLIRSSEVGIEILHRPSASASPWAENAWTERLVIDATSIEIDDLHVLGDLDIDAALRVDGNISSDGHITLPTEIDDTPASNSIYATSVARAEGEIEIDGAGNITAGASGFGYTAVLTGSAPDVVVRVTLNNAVTSRRCVVTGAEDRIAASIYNLTYAWNSSTQIDFSIRNDAGNRVDIGSSIALSFSFAVFGRN